MIVLFAPVAAPPTATHRPREGENAMERTFPRVVLLILTVAQFAPPFTERYITFPLAVPARMTEKSGLAAKHDTMVPEYVAGYAANHAATASASPEYIIRPFALFDDTSLPPINHRLYPPPTQSDAYTHAICEVFGLLTPFRQLNPSFEK
jgi:hypothetical protein